MSPRIDQILSSMGEGMYGLDMDGRCTFVNLAAQRMLGYSEQELLDVVIRPLIEVSAEHSGAFVNSVDSVEVTQEMYRRKDGSTFHVSYTVSPLLSDTTITGAVVVFRDATLRVEQEQRLQDSLSRIEAINRELDKERHAAEQASIAKSAFLANMSHEIRTPLNGVIGMASLLQQTDLNAKQRKYVERITLSSMILLELISDVLDLTKIEAGQLQVEAIPFDLRAIIADIRTLFTMKAEEKGIDLQIHIEDDVAPQVIGDPTRVRQVLSNLVSNALKFTHEGAVAVSVFPVNTDLTHQEVKVTVSDTGIGITHEKLEMLFQKFQQADASITRKYGGSGLGLALSKELIHTMGGHIGAESVAGKGSTFWFSIPFQLVPKNVEVKV